MVARMNKYRSVNLTRVIMKIVGFWRAESEFEQRVMTIAFYYTLLAIIFAMVVQWVDLYFTFGDFYALTSNLCISMLLVTVLVKLTSFMYYRVLVMKLITYAENNFWEVEYGDYGNEVLAECDRKGVALIYSFTTMVEVCACNYLIAPLIENRGRNETDRLLPFRLWVDLPLTTTPYYEITYAIQGLSTVHTGICIFCFDNFICCFNIHVAAQLKILGHKFQSIIERYVKHVEKNENSDKASKSACIEFVNCVHEHRNLISYVELMEVVFTWILFGQLLLSSAIICFGGFQILATTNFFRRLIFLFHFVGSISQLFIYAWTCNDITYQSEIVSDCAYNMGWYLLPDNEYGRFIKYGVMMVMTRVRHPCVLTAGKFAPMSLQTFRSVRIPTREFFYKSGTAASYFTLLQQLSGDDV